MLAQWELRRETDEKSSVGDGNIKDQQLLQLWREDNVMMTFWRALQILVQDVVIGSRIEKRDICP